MFETEFIRIFSRKIALLAMILPVFLLLIYCSLGMYFSEYLIDNGVIYRDGDAVRRDKEITAEFSGPMTAETVKDIWEKFGPPIAYNTPNKSDEYLRQAAVDGGSDNSCNRLVTQLFCDEIVDENGNAAYILKENLSENPYLQGDFYFGYTGKGWSGFREFFIMVSVMTGLVVIISLCSTFSEDYAFRTADIFLPTVKGRFYLWKARLLAGCCFATIYYWLLGALLFVDLWVFYGLDGLWVSGHFTDQYLFMEPGAPLWKEVVILYLGCWLAVLVLTGAVMAVSALCKRSFGSLVWSIGLYFGPHIIVRVVLNQLSVSRFLMWVQVVVYGLPFSYALMCLNAPAVLGLVMTGVEVIVGSIGAVLSGRGWCRHQVEE